MNEGVKITLSLHKMFPLCINIGKCGYFLFILLSPKVSNGFHHMKLPLTTPYPWSFHLPPLWRFHLPLIVATSDDRRYFLSECIALQKSIRVMMSSLKIVPLWTGKTGSTLSNIEKTEDEKYGQSMSQWSIYKGWDFTVVHFVNINFNTNCESYIYLT